MPDYQLFGGVLRSELVFPELIPADGGEPSWIFSRDNESGASLATVDSRTSRATADSGPWPVPRPLGSESVDPGVSVALFAVRDSLRLVFDDTGTFDISSDGRTIRWHPPARPDLDAVRKDVMGRVIALCLQQQGVTTLHGSAVELADVAVAFLAPKYHGKSTTAAALIEAGARPLSDDLVAVTAGDTPSVLSSAPLMHLWKDSAEQVLRASRGAQIEAGTTKLQIQWDKSARMDHTPVRLGGVYLLAPVRALGMTGIRRVRMGGVQAALALLGQSKVGALIGVERRGALLQRLGDLADRVPVYRLEVPRDFERLPELTSTIFGWHDSVGAH
jgi:hypothetical protein